MTVGAVRHVGAYAGMEAGGSGALGPGTQDRRTDLHPELETDKCIPVEVTETRLTGR